MNTLIDEIFVESELDAFEIGDIFSFVSGKAGQLVSFLQKGVITLQIVQQFIKGEVTDLNKLTNLIFYNNVPEAKGRKKLTSAEVKYWIKVRDEMVLPFFSKADNFKLSNGAACTITDLRSQVPKQIVKGSGSKQFNLVKHERNLADVNAIILHQMAFTRGNDLSRYLKVGSHYIVMQDGKIGQLRNNATYLNASNCFNSRGIAIEFAGNFPNSKLKWWSGSKDRNFVTPAQIIAGRCLVKKLAGTVASISNIHAHRQTSPTRENCPGPDIWFNIGEWAINNLSLTDKDKSGHSVAICSGNTIPPEWRRSR